MPYSQMPYYFSTADPFFERSKRRLLTEFLTAVEQCNLQNHFYYATPVLYEDS